MKCDYCVIENLSDGRFLYKCSRCGTLAKAKYADEIVSTCGGAPKVYCVFEVDGDDPTYVRCVRGGCDNKLPRQEGLELSQYHATCRGEGPGIIQKAANFAKAAAAHVATGAQTVSDEIAARRAEICRGCELFAIVGDGGYCSHKSCGCETTNTEKFAAKQKWAESACPSPKGDKWRMTDEELTAVGHPERKVG